MRLGLGFEVGGVGGGGGTIFSCSCGPKLNEGEKRRSNRSKYPSPKPSEPAALADVGRLRARYGGADPNFNPNPSPNLVEVG